MWVHYYFASMIWTVKLTLWSICALFTYLCVFASSDFDPRSGVTVDGDANLEAVYVVI